MTVWDVLRNLWCSPRKMLIDRWNWKSAVFSSVIRAMIFFFCNLKAGLGAATGAMLAEFAYRSIVAGFCGALTQSFRRARPTWAANIAVILLLPFASHSIELLVHLARHTPKLFVSIVTSVCFTIVSTLFNLYAMRRGALIVGEDACSAAHDMRRVPALIAGFVACGPVALYRICNRIVTRSPEAVRGVISTTFILVVAGFQAQGQDMLQRSARKYNATAYISLLGVNIFSRSGVGGGFAVLEERGTPAHRHSTLQFLSGSAPERAHGLNRLGYIQEEIDEQDQKLSSVRYFGFITANKEESLAQAKAALEAHQGETAAYVAANGISDRNTARYSVRSMSLPAQYHWQDSEQLLKSASARFAEARETRGQARSSSAVTDAFLDALVRAIRSDRDRDDHQIVHNGKLFRLRTEKDADVKTGEELERRGVLKAANCVRLKGTLRGEGSADETNFRLWYDRSGDNPLPVRFEFRPRSFLRLVFDATSEKGNARKASDRLAAELPPASLNSGVIQ